MPLTGRNPSERASVTITARVTPEEKQQVVDAARAADRDVSAFVRLSVLEGTIATERALAEAEQRGHRAARDEADRELHSLQTELQSTKQALVESQSREEELERHISSTSANLMAAVADLFAGRAGAQPEVVRLWACIPLDERPRILLAVTALVSELIVLRRGPRTTLQSDIEDWVRLFDLTVWVSQALDPNVGYPQSQDATIEWAWDRVKTALDASALAINQLPITERTEEH
jgi:uncharacterized protein (DUF1778 family)